MDREVWWAMESQRVAHDLVTTHTYTHIIHHEEYSQYFIITVNGTFTVPYGTLNITFKNWHKELSMTITLGYVSSSYLTRKLTNKAKQNKTSWFWVEGFPGSSDGKESAWNVGDLGSIPELGRSAGEREWLPTEEWFLFHFTIEFLL